MDQFYESVILTVKIRNKEYLSAGTSKAQIGKIFLDTICCIYCAAAVGVRMEQGREDQPDELRDL